MENIAALARTWALALLVGPPLRFRSLRPVAAPAVVAPAPAVHVFERAGLGRAPFRFERFEVSKYQACHGAPIQPGTSCDYCGTGIMNVFWIRSADAKEFKVGCDCVHKTGDAGLVKAVRDEERRQARAKSTAKRDEQAAKRAAETRRKNDEERAAFLAKHEGLADDLKVEHRIIADIAARFAEYRTLSDKQVALVRKLAAEVRNPAPAEVNVPAPEGRVVVRGKVVSTKLVEGDWGTTWKMTVKVETPDGAWLCWGSVPTGISVDGLRGQEIEFTATLSRGRDAHFALFKRPAKASVVAT